MATKKQRKAKVKKESNRKIIYSLATIAISLAIMFALKIARSTKLSINEVAPPVARQTPPFGLMLGNQPFNEITAALSSKAGYYRSGITLTKMTDPSYKNPENIRKIVDAGLKSVLTVSYDGGKENGTKSIAGPADITILKANLAQAIDQIHPTIVVYENEEDSYNQNFYTGTNAQYLAGLKAVCDVAHAKSIFCANGGITSASSIFLTANYYESISPNASKYTSITTDTMGSEFIKAFDKNGKTMKAPIFQNRINKAKELVTSYKASGADLLNFHWYHGNPTQFTMVADYLTQLSGLPVMTNELGIMNTTTTLELTEFMQVIKDKNIPVAIFYSFDDVKWNTRSLFNQDGTLRDLGTSFKTFIETHY